MVLARIKTAALIIRVKRPRVKMFIGRVRRIRIGRISALMRPRTITVTKSDQVEANPIPGTR